MGIVKSDVIKPFYLKDNGRFPNNTLPALLYKGILNLPLLFAADEIVARFKSNDWENSWKAGVYTYHHYHSVTHEVLGFYKGKTTLMLGGEDGEKIIVEKGDVLIIPAGVAHKNLHKENDVQCVGAYPHGINYDMNYGKEGERPKTDENIAEVNLPAKDPIFGTEGGLLNYWE